MTRTVTKHTRFYMDGYDLSGYSRSVGPLEVTFDTAEDAAFTDEVKNVLPGQANVNIGTLNGYFDNTASTGLHVVASGAGVIRNVMVPIGFLTAPAAGDPVFLGQYEQQTYMQEGDLNSYVTMGFGGWSGSASTLLYNKPWGYLLHAKGAETAVNTAVGLDDRGASTSLGGFFAYQIFSSNGTVTVKAQDASTNTNVSFSDLSGATSGSVDASSAPKHGIVALSTTATIRRYTRWQIVFGTATTVTFAAALVRI